MTSMGFRFPQKNPRCEAVGQTLGRVPPVPGDAELQRGCHQGCAYYALPGIYTWPWYIAFVF